MFLVQPARAGVDSRRAAITGGGGNGNCTVEVDVDGAAEVEVSGDHGLLTTLAGRDARWRRFQCNGPLPRNPVDFRLVRIAGRGTVRLMQDPRTNGGRAVIQIDDARGGRSGYTFAFQWRGFGGGDWPSGPPAPPPGPWPGGGGFTIAKAIRACQGAVTDRLTQDGYSYVNFDRTVPDDGPGRNDWIVGTVSGKREFRPAWFSFSCSVDFRSGRIRSADVYRR
jgi:hypothetical protein